MNSILTWIARYLPRYFRKLLERFLSSNDERIDVDSAIHPTLHRAITRPSWIRQNSAAFILRAPTETRAAERELSVVVEATCSEVLCAARQSKCFGEFQLNTNNVLALDELRIKFDLSTDVDYSPIHAGILGLPLNDGSDLEAVERMASLLSDLIETTRSRPGQEERFQP